MTGVLTQAPPCNPATIVGACRGGCGRTMHSGAGRTCREGHPRHGGRHLCPACRLAHHQAGTLDQFPPASRTLHGAPPLAEEDPEYALDEWADIGGDFATFGRRVGMTQAAWERVFKAAEAAGDPRAVRR